MSFASGIRLVTPIDKDAPHRTARLRELGIEEKADPEFDEFARILAQDMDAAFAFVNLISSERQFLAGVYPSSEDRGEDPETDSLRSQGCEIGYCLNVVTRGHAMALDEVMDYHRFASNPVVTGLGVRAYLGAPLVDETMILGTTCVVDTEPHDWGREGIAFIKGRAAELVARIRERAGLPALPSDASNEA